MPPDQENALLIQLIAATQCISTQRFIIHNMHNKCIETSQYHSYKSSIAIIYRWTIYSNATKPRQCPSNTIQCYTMYHYKKCCNTIYQSKKYCNPMYHCINTQIITTLPYHYWKASIAYIYRCRIFVTSEQDTVQCSIMNFHFFLFNNQHSFIIV